MTDGLALSPAVRLWPPTDATGGTWTAVHLLERRRYELSAEAASALLARATAAGSDVVADLRRRRLLVDERSGDGRTEWLLRLQAAWRAKGWDQAADYHAFAFDMAGGSVAAAGNTPTGAPVAQRAEGARLTCSDLERICAVAPQVGEARTHAVAVGVAGLEAGAYRVDSSCKPPALVRLDGGTLDPHDARHVFAHSLGRPPFPFPTGAVLVLTTAFGAYRDGDARAFRAVHVDAGRVAARLVTAARAQDIPCGLVYCDPAERIEELLALDPAREGYMCTIALGHGAASAVRRPSAGVA